ncbi:hypothetical protein J1C49_14870 [Cognatishimia sp. F0-27]|nr:hypothetical protein [Cognatishimia sp. F0-27]
MRVRTRSFRSPRGKPRMDCRRVSLGDIPFNYNGLQWRDVPAIHEPRKMLYSRWTRWSEKGIFDRMMAGLTAKLGELKSVMILSPQNSVPTAGQRTPLI